MKYMLTFIENDIRNYKKIFIKLDKNKNNQLEREELVWGL